MKFTLTLNKSHQKTQLIQPPSAPSTQDSARFEWWEFVAPSLPPVLWHKGPTSGSHLREHHWTTPFNGENTQSSPLRTLILNLLPKDVEERRERSNSSSKFECVKANLVTLSTLSNLSTFGRKGNLILGILTLRHTQIQISINTIQFQFFRSVYGVLHLSIFLGIAIHWCFCMAAWYTIKSLATKSPLQPGERQSLSNNPQAFQEHHKKKSYPPKV